MSDITRNVSQPTQRLLWGIAAGRCEFYSCNKKLYRHSITKIQDNYADKAHIRAVSPKGPRHNKDMTEGELNDINNLMLLCHECHITIDRSPQDYPVEILYKMKLEHEKRIEAVTDIAPESQSTIIFYTENIGDSHLLINHKQAMDALIKQKKYPSDGSPIILGQSKSELMDRDEEYFRINEINLVRAFKRQVSSTIVQGQHVSIFALAPQPLLIKLGTLINDKYNADVYQCHREGDKWSWKDINKEIEFIKENYMIDITSNDIALIIALSAHIEYSRVENVLGKQTPTYRITIKSPNRNFVDTPSIMTYFVQAFREIMEEIKINHGKKCVVHMFPSMPNSLAVKLGMDYMLKTDPSIHVYDEIQDVGFKYALTIGGLTDE